MQRIKIDFDNPGLPKRLDVMENDAQSRFFEAELYQGGKAYSAPSGATYSIMYHGFGPQNEGWYDTINDGAGKRAACTVSGNVVTCELARQALQVPGHVSVVLAVTTAKGYIIKSWPIDCNCRNDNYDSTAEVEGFFYITKITNEEWGKAIAAWEDFKNMIDPTLSLSGKAADAKETGDKIGELKEDLGDLTSTIISAEKSNITENIDNYENIKSTIIKSNGKLESNSYTTRFIVQKYTNLAKGLYVVKGFCQGSQCLYVLCDKNGGVIKYEDSTSQGSSGTKTVDITIDEHNTILYVGGHETVTAVVKKYLYDTKLTTRFSNIYRKKVTLNGDSIAFGAGTGGTGFMDYIATKYNMTLDKKAVSGATIANLSSRYPDKHCICTSIDTMAEDANYIIFEGGYNDWLLWTQIGALTDTMTGDLDDTKFYGALESICRQALAKWENGKIGFIITHKINDAWRTQKQEGVTYPTLDGYYQAIKNVCEKYSIPYLDLSKVSGLNTELQNYKKYTYNSDGVHPTKDGYQIFYVNTIARWMENL